MKVALVHDWLTGLRGGERCLQAFLAMYPQADIHTLIHVQGSTDAAIDARVQATSLLQRFPGVRHYYRLLLPLYPWAVRGFDFSGYDLVISLSHAAAKNIRVPKGIPHLCYCFTPMRYIWDQAQQYLGRTAPMFWPAISYLRHWDLEGSRGPSELVAISRFVAARIRCFYGREASVIYPPVDASWIAPRKAGQPGEAFLYAGALVRYKKPGLVVEAFNRLGEPLWIVGAGPEERQLRRAAAANIRFFGRVPDLELAEFYRRCRALVFPGTEDFGLVPVECMAAGRPVVGLHDGALRETLVGLKPWNALSDQPSRPSGVFVAKTHNELDSLISSIYYFREHEHLFDSEACREQAAKFSPERFIGAWSALAARFGFEVQPAVPSLSAGVAAAEFAYAETEKATV